MPATVPADVDKALLAGDPAPSGLSAEERRAYEQLVSDVQAGRLREVDGVAPADVVRHRGFARRSGRLAPRPQRRRRPAGRGGHLGAGPGHERHGRTDARRDPRQHHALLADQHRGLCVSPLLGVQGRLLQRQGRLDPGGRDASFPASNTTPRGAGPSGPTTTSSTSTRSTRAGTLPPGSSRSCSRTRFARRSGRCARRSRRPEACLPGADGTGSRAW